MRPKLRHAANLAASRLSHACVIEADKTISDCDLDLATTPQLPHHPFFCLKSCKTSAMFSGSNSYLGGQSGRPGGPQQFNSFPNQQGQQQPQQQGFMNPNPTGFGQQAPLQPNFTGYPMQPQQTGFQQPQQMQQQQTGFPGQQQQFNNAQAPQQQSFQTGAPPMPQIPQQYQSQAQQQPPAAPAQKPQPTGFAQMADSFRSSPAAAAPARGRRASKSKGSKIPNIRLSFITAQDQAKFETLFKSAAGDEQTLSGDKSRDLLMRSKLDGNALSQIW